MNSVVRGRGRGRPSRHQDPMSNSSPEILSVSPLRTSQTPNTQSVYPLTSPEGQQVSSSFLHLLQRPRNRRPTTPKYPFDIEEDDDNSRCDVCDRPNRVLLCKTCGHNWQV